MGLQCARVLDEACRHIAYFFLLRNGEVIQSGLGYFRCLESRLVHCCRRRGSMELRHRQRAYFGDHIYVVWPMPPPR